MEKIPWENMTIGELKKFVEGKAVIVDGDEKTLNVLCQICESRLAEFEGVICYYCKDGIDKEK